MSEEEITEKYHHFKIKTADGIELDLIETKYYKELLDLYKKEKEKNKEYEKQLDLDYVEKNYISKDKIKDMMKHREFELQQEYKEFEEDVE